MGILQNLLPSNGPSIVGAPRSESILLLGVKRRQRSKSASRQGHQHFSRTLQKFGSGGGESEQHATVDKAGARLTGTDDFFYFSSFIVFLFHLPALPLSAECRVFGQPSRTWNRLDVVGLVVNYLPVCDRFASVASLPWIIFQEMVVDLVANITGHLWITFSLMASIFTCEMMEYIQ
ncbi:hypothetical protein CDAR_27691 [Caerostris darwini]|uniref:Uncharacterized protein n=1 Tax=Caerostris darwini TaxID=1538125 RepID=A0AAV4SP28_9ARAC|nr:hypothetical protein CDAR_27691 [Caerostris darwini]